MTIGDAERALVEILTKPGASGARRRSREDSLAQLYGLFRSASSEIATAILPLIRVGGPHHSRFTSFAGSDRIRLEEVLAQKFRGSAAHALDSRGIGSRGVSTDFGNRGLVSYGSRGTGAVERGLAMPLAPMGAGSASGSASPNSPSSVQSTSNASSPSSRRLRNVHPMPWIGRIHNTWSAALRRRPWKHPERPHDETGADLPAGTVVRVVNRDGNWLYVEVELNGRRLEGYVSEELVKFEREDASPVSPGRLTTRSHHKPRHAAAGPKGPTDRQPPDEPIPGPDKAKGRDHGHVDPPIRDDLKDLLDDLRQLVRLLRAAGRSADAGKLDRLVEKLSTLAISIGMVIGAYYLGLKIGGGRILILWGWNAIGERFTKATARLERLRLLPQAEEVLKDIVEVVRRNEPTVVGSGVPWKVLGQVVDLDVPMQLDSAACGPACIQQVLRSRGVEISQRTLIQRARESVLTTRSGLVATTDIRDLLQHYDPSGEWTAAPLPESIREMGYRRGIQELSGKGPWIAVVGPHAVVVEGIDRYGRVVIRDPWPEPAWDRGIRAGSRYVVTTAEFRKYWFGESIYRRPDGVVLDEDN
jgi:hypothetical protein